MQLEGSIGKITLMVIRQLSTKRLDESFVSRPIDDDVLRRYLTWSQYSGFPVGVNYLILVP